MCDERERLIGYVYDEVDAPERNEVERHLESCAECRDEIRGLRRVRQDLLAWDVPEHGSVWQPFAPARLRPWWREVPAWAMAVAATIMFLIGAAGGVATHAFTDRPALAATQAAAPATPPAQVMPASISPADLETVRHEIADLRSEMDQRVRLVSTHAATSAGVSDRDFQQVRAMLNSGNQRDSQLMDVVFSLNRDLVTVKSDQNARINALDQRLRQLSDALAAMQAGGSGGKQ
jgi:anti-sigma factor RsiW